MKNILEVKNLCTSFFTEEGEVKAVNGVSFSVPSGRTLGIVGESGSGKSITSLSILRLIQSPGKIKSGKILFDGKDLLQLSEKDMRKIRGNEISMIFQEPMTSLNPVFTIGEQISEVYQIHRNLSKREAKEKSIEMLKLVGIPSPEKRIDQYPHELSGGMRQRVMIAMALACNPKLLIADEPTTALDVTIQKQILNLMKKLNRETGTAIALITHDLGVVAQMCERIIVMYAGRIVEEGSVKDIFNNPGHPYTQGLIASVPDMRKEKGRLYSIPGNVPKPGSIRQGCLFAPRCEYVMERCLVEHPSLIQIDEKHRVRCFLHDESEKTL